MKIGILTLPFNNNYGGYLQCYALMTFLKREGHDVELIYRRHPKAPLTKKIVPTVKNIVKVLIGRKVLSIIPDEEKVFRARGEAMMPFLDERITPKSKPLYTSEEFRKYVSGRYDAVIVGSDQVWRPEYGPNIRDYFFCGITDERLIRISYAASFGTDEPKYSIEEMNDCGKALLGFRAISVRESSGLDFIRSLTDKLSIEPQLVLDPTLLLTSNDYNDIIPEGFSPTKGKVFCYILDTNATTDEVIAKVCRQLNKSYYSISDIQREKAVLPSIESWLSAIRDSDFVITDSFHGMVFSVIYKKDFLVCPNITRGASRFLSFLKQLGLENRIVISKDKIDDSRVEWDKVNEKLENKIALSVGFIKDNIR